MDFGTFLDRMFTHFWIVLWVGCAVMLWISTVKIVIKEGALEAILMVFLSSFVTTTLLAADALKILWS